MESNLYKNYKESKLRLLNKYKRFSKNLARTAINENAFVSINDFLASDQSLGPDADPGSIYYHYTHFENINNYMKILMNEMEYKNIICMPNMNGKYSKYIIRNAITYHSNYDFIVIPESAIKEILDCTAKRFIYIIFNVYWDNTDIGHANILIIDNLKKTIERFEPHGELIRNHFSDKDKVPYLSIKHENDRIDKKFNKDLLKKIHLEGYKYISPIDISPKIGIQTTADAYGGMCVTYTLIYLQLRIMNPDIDQKTVIKYLISKDEKEIVDIILRYAKYVENTLKKNSQLVIKDGNELFIDEYNKGQKYIFIDDNGSRTFFR